MNLPRLIERLRRLGIAEWAELAQELERHTRRVKALENRLAVASVDERARLAAMLRKAVDGKSTEHDAGIRYAASLVEGAA